MSALVEGLVALLAAIPDAAAGADEAQRARLIAELDRAKASLAGVTPNLPAVDAAIAKRREELADG